MLESINAFLICINSPPINLEVKDNIIPGLDNEIITVQKDKSSFPCYKVISKGNHFNRLNGQYRTFKIDLDRGDYDRDFHIQVSSMPLAVIFYATTFEDSFGYEDPEFLNQNPHVTEVPWNRHVTVSYKTKKIELLKEKHTNCEEESLYEVFEKAFVSKARKTCQNPCSPYAYHLPNNVLDFCEVEFHDYNDYNCSVNVFISALQDVQDSYSNMPCNKMYYEGHVLQDYLFQGKSDYFKWPDPSETDLIIPNQHSGIENPEIEFGLSNVSVMFSYNFEFPETMTVEVESYIFTFMDLIGIIGGTFSMFVGFAFYDNIISLIDYIIVIWNFVKKMSRKRISKVKNESSVESNNQNDSKHKPKQPGLRKPNDLEQANASLKMDTKKNEPSVESINQNDSKHKPKQPVLTKPNDLEQANTSLKMKTKKNVPNQPKRVVQGKPNQKENSGPSETKKKLERKPKTQESLAKTNVKVKETKTKKQ